ncbi:sigma factor-like helix-turn-helix DNA-binding protein [Oceanobacillus sp. FSL H7-0719]|uniref:sigma factor-like helix-turn-helix DNA-binding protein n=1 Tax=Oceanobacillus sp. FSL H7-0719 TaxID=2954507 RepID=UPI003246BD10
MRQEVKAQLTAKQWDWVYYYIMLELPLKEIAEMKGVSVEAVKSWGKEARKKLRMGNTWHNPE